MPLADPEQKRGNGRTPGVLRCCPVCRSTYTAAYHSKAEARYLACRECGTIFQHPAPAREQIQGYAEAEYNEGGLYREYVDAREMKIAHFRERLRAMRRHLPAGGRLLDVGCSCGYFLEVAEGDGFEVRDLELSKTAIDAASATLRSKITQGGLESVPDEEGAYDVITAFDVIEHLEHPLDFLSRARRLLRPGGRLVISTPDVDHFLRPLMRASWPMLQPMQHLTLFSRRSLRRALADAGFAETVVETAWKVLSWDYLVRQLCTLNPRLFSLLSAALCLVPRKTRRRERRLNIGEMLAVARAGE